MSEDRPHKRRRGDTRSQSFGVGGEPSPLVGATRGLAKVAGAVGALVAAAAVIAAIVALLY